MKSGSVLCGKLNAFPLVVFCMYQVNPEKANQQFGELSLPKSPQYTPTILSNFVNGDLYVVV